MHRRHQHLNIPIEIVRTVVAIAETGSLSKAGERLGLSQPAISSQVKRLQNLVGGALFLRTANGTTTTELGKLALQQARRILEANDQLLRLGGNNVGPQPVRLGLSTLFVEEFVKHQTVETLDNIFVYTDHSLAIGRGLIDGYVDIACIYENPAVEAEIERLIVNEFEESSVWVRAREFVLSPGAPIPILTWPGDDWMIRTLTKHGLSYKIVFNSPDYHARLAATRAGIGLTAIPVRMVPPYLAIAREYYLPELPSRKSLLCVRLGLEGDQMTALVKHLSALFFERDKGQ
jgi:DNA-binding transcriptional LysR family regulator